MGFFKAYDMRGTFGVDFDLDVVRRVGVALPQVVSGQRWLIGRDCRASSAAIRNALVEGLHAAGADVTDLGLVTTSMVYFFTASEEFDGSVMITASHNPPGDNGLKVSRKGGLPVGYADGLDRVERLVAAMPRVPSVQLPDAAPTTDAARLSRYVAWQRAQMHEDLSALSFAVDCSNGMSSLLAHQLFPQAVFLNDVPDGAFPAHSPNPLKEEARAQLSEVVRTQKLDCGLIFDGDADRVIFVDEKGTFVQPDYLLPIVAQAMLRGATDAARGMRPKVVHDVRTSRGVIETLCELGCETVMAPVGHAHAKPVMRREHALCGGELAGHYYFGDFFGCDSGVLAASRILGEIARAKRTGRSFSDLMRPIVTRYANSGELNYRIEDKEAAIARLLRCAAECLPAERARITLDGLRLEYDAGWVNVRKSNTEPYLRLVIEHKTPEGLQNWRKLLEGALKG